MNQETLRKWANDSLSEQEKTRVYRWMVRCTSPDLPDLLHGLLRDRRERLRDQDLAAKGGLWRSLVENWNTNLNAGNASWVSPEPAIKVASIDTTEARSVWIEESDEKGAILELNAPHSIEMIAFLTTDDGTVQRLCSRLSNTRLSIPLSTTARRPTIWVLSGPQLPVLPDDPAAALMLLLATEAVNTQAIRWRP